MATTPLHSSQEVYQRAVELFIKQHGADIKKRQWLSDKYSLNDVETAVMAAKAQYEHRTNSRVQKALARFSATFMYYSKIGDMFAQHHPEYTSLAWGTMKLLFVLVLNHEETLTKIAESLTLIADVLPRVNVHLELYPTATMKRNLDELYMLLIEFYRRTLKWYSAGPLKHVVRSFTAPYSLRFADIVAQMKAKASFIDDLATTMAYSELRTMHELLQSSSGEQKRLRNDFDRFAAVLLSVQDAQSQTGKQIESMQNMIIAHSDMASTALQQTRRMTIEMQVTMMINTTTVDFLLRPRETLQKRLAILRHKPTASRPCLQMFWKANPLTTWNEEASSSLLLVIGSTAFRDHVNTAATLMTDLIVHETTTPIIWALKGSQLGSRGCSVIDLVRYLAMQALQLSPLEAGKQISDNFNSARVASASTEKDWLKVLLVLLQSFPRVYLVIDAEILGALGSDSEGPPRLLRLLQSFIAQQTQSIVKVALLTYRKVALANAFSALSGAPNVHWVQMEKIFRQKSALPGAINSIRSSYSGKDRRRFKSHVTSNAVGLQKRSTGSL